jgi:hypothetical protein
MANKIDAKTYAKTQARKINFPLALAATLALAFGSSISGCAYAAKQSPMHDSSYSSAQAIPKKVLGKNKEEQKSPGGLAKAKAHAKCRCARAMHMAAKAEKSNELGDALAISNDAGHGKKPAKKLPWKGILAGTGIIGAAAAAYAISRRKKPRRAKPRSKTRFEGIVRRFKENIALRRARHVIMSQKLIAVPSKKKPGLTVEAITARAIAIARTVKNRKEARSFLMDVEKELTTAFGTYDPRMRDFYAGLKSV